jgi:hypothetical protein
MTTWRLLQQEFFRACEEVNGTGRSRHEILLCYLMKHSTLVRVVDGHKFLWLTDNSQLSAHEWTLQIAADDDPSRVTYRVEVTEDHRIRFREDHDYMNVKQFRSRVFSLLDIGQIQV